MVVTKLTGGGRKCCTIDCDQRLIRFSLSLLPMSSRSLCRLWLNAFDEFIIEVTTLQTYEA